MEKERGGARTSSIRASYIYQNYREGGKIEKNRRGPAGEPGEGEVLK